MAEADYVSPGDVLDHTPGSAVAAGQVVVVGDLVGVAERAIAANTPGSIRIEGVFDVAKGTGAGTDYAAGTLLYWDNTNNVVTTTASGNKKIGYTPAATTTAATTVNVKLSR